IAGKKAANLLATRLPLPGFFCRTARNVNLGHEKTRLGVASGEWRVASGDGRVVIARCTAKPKNTGNSTHRMTCEKELGSRDTTNFNEALKTCCSGVFCTSYER